MMFSSNATRLARIDWSKYGRMELTGTTEPTNEQLKRAVEGLSVGMQQLAEELANVLGNYDLPLQHRASFVSSNYTPDAPGVSPDEDELDKFYPQIAALANDGYYDDDDDQIKGGLAALFRGPVVFQPAINNPNVAGGNAQNNIVVFGGQGGGACFDNLYVTNIYDKATGAVWSAFPAGTVTLWAGSVGSIPSGWALMDGTANSVGNGGSGIDMRGLIPYGYSGSGAFATIGGSVATALTFNVAGGTTAALTINNATTGITIGDHDLNHTHEITPSQVASALSSHTTSNHTHTVNYSGNDGTASAGSADVDFASGITTSSAGSESLSHSGTGSNIVTTNTPALNPITHTITEPNSGTGHSHTGTVSVNTLASSLTTSAPTTLRTPGVVLAYIEKLA